MLEFFTSDSNTVFNIAIVIVLLFGLLEGLALLLGASLMSIIDNLSPFDVDLSSEMSKSPELSDPGIGQFFSWLSLDKLPLMIWLVVFLTSFGLLGYTINFTSNTLLAFNFPTFISVPLAIILGLILTGRFGNGLSRYIPKNESSAVSVSSFSGKIAVITGGTARVGSPAEAKVIDDFNQAHYILVEPLEPDREFVAGEQVLLIEKTERSWQATRYSML